MPFNNSKCADNDWISPGTTLSGPSGSRVDCYGNATFRAAAAGCRAIFAPSRVATCRVTFTVLRFDFCFGLAEETCIKIGSEMFLPTLCGVIGLIRPRVFPTIVFPVLGPLR